MLRRERRDRDQLTALWLFGLAVLVFAMVVVGGATRLTGSGLSITEWKPILGAIPPLTEADWRDAFEKYQAIPQYQQINAGMSLEAFKGIFWWEWAHRFLGRFIGLAFALPFVVLLVLRRIPRRLIVRCLILLGLGGLQGLIGWWMVASGLSERVDVAPERLAVHLGLALLIFVGLIWTALEAWAGPAQPSPQSKGWSRAALAVLIAVFVQCLLGALVAGGKAGFIYTDWPLMNGQVLAPVNGSMGLLAVLHDQALTQFNHRLGGYALFVGTLVYAVMAWRSAFTDWPLQMSRILIGAVVLQAVLGIVTLVHAVPLALGVAHQAGAVVVLLLATANLWLVRRASPGRRFWSAGDLG